MSWALIIGITGQNGFGLVGLDSERHVRVEEGHFRPTAVEELRSDAPEDRHRLGWQSRSTLGDRVRLLREHDLAAAGIVPAQRLPFP